MGYELIKSRLDLTDWVIHFTRDTEDGTRARDNLLKIIRTGTLIPNWSLRRGVRTIYGPHPAVCFTEQPLWAFMQYVQQRNNTNTVSGYGLAVHKHDLFSEGGLPVIYGLEMYPEVESDPPTSVRQLDPEYLIAEEQYRLVRYNPSPSNRNPIDWTHEREWRWSAKSNPFEKYLLGVMTRGVTGRTPSEGRYAIIVQNDEDVHWLTDDVLPTLTKGNAADMYTNSWYRKVTSSPRIISLQTVQAQLGAGRQEYGKVDTFPFQR